MKEIKVRFTDFWSSFDPYDNVFVRLLSAKFHVVVMSGTLAERPDMLIYSAFGIEHYKYEDCVKVYYTGENDVPNFNECDYGLSFHHIDFGGRHFRYPLYMMYEIDEAILKPAISDRQALEREFCSVLMKNAANCNRQRLRIIEAVDSYKSVAFGGPYRNNIGGNIPIDGKIPFISGYKFNLALENSAIHGYITEKIVEPFAAATVPIYWGAPDIKNEFNPEAFINVGDYRSIDAFIDDLKLIDNNPERYLRILRAPRLNSDKNLDYNERLQDYLCNIAETLKVRRSLNAMEHNNYRRSHILMKFGEKKLAGKRVVNILGKMFGI